MSTKTKTEHSGAKNGGGYRGKRVEAKKRSKSLRRINQKKEIREEIATLWKNKVD